MQSLSSLLCIQLFLRNWNKEACLFIVALAGEHCCYIFSQQFWSSGQGDICTDLKMLWLWSTPHGSVIWATSNGFLPILSGFIWLYFVINVHAAEITEFFFSPECQLMILLDLMQSTQSSQRLTKTDIHRRSNKFCFSNISIKPHSTFSLKVNLKFCMPNFIYFCRQKELLLSSYWSLKLGFGHFFPVLYFIRAMLLKINRRV